MAGLGIVADVGVAGRRSAGGAWRRAVVWGALAVAVALWVWVVLTLWPQPGAMIAVALAFTAALIGAMGFVVAVRQGLTGFRTAIHDAHRGHLAPVHLHGPARAIFGSLAAEYNALSRDLGSVFTDMEQAQLSIIGERNRHEAILRSLPGALLIVCASRRVLRTNRQAEALFERPAQSIEGADLFELLRTDATGRDRLENALASAEPLRNLELTLALASQQRHVALNLAFFKQTPEASEVCAAIMLQDVTEYKRLEEATHQTEKLVAMGRLAAGVAHELNTPLGTILGYARMLEEGVPSDQRRADYAHAIHGEAQRCSRIVDNLLAYARHHGCPAETCEINALIVEARDAVANCQGRRLGVPIECRTGEPIQVRGGSGLLDIVLVNLLVNAVQAASTSAQPRVELACSVEDRFAVVAVTDNGPGVPAENQQRIFDPFFTTKPDGLGTGLGLAVSHSIVARIGGTLRCDPSMRDGARFLLSLPLAA